jgi:hypothetical protein
MLHQAKDEASSLLASLYRRLGDTFVAITMFKEAISSYQTGLTYEVTTQFHALIVLREVHVTVLRGCLQQMQGGPAEHGHTHMLGKIDAAGRQG